jgi:hypothetical protein
MYLLHVLVAPLKIVPRKENGHMLFMSAGVSICLSTFVPAYIFITFLQ